MPITQIDDSLLEKEGRFHTCLDDVPNLGAKQMKEFMDYVPRQVIIPALNRIADEVYSKGETDLIISEKADAGSVMTKQESLDKISSLLTGTVAGESAVIDDIVDFEHPLDIWLSNKNLIPCIYPNKEQTVSGITFRMDPNGTIEMSGTSTASASFTVYFKDDKLLPDGLVPGEKYTVYCETSEPVSGCSFIVNYYNDPPKGANYLSWVSTAVGGGKSKSALLPETAIGVRMYINVTAGQTYQSVLLYPMIERGGQMTGYAQHVPELCGITVTLEDENHNLTNYTADGDARVQGVNSIYPKMILHSGTAGVLVNCRYRKDITKAFGSLLKKIENGG